MKYMVFTDSDLDGATSFLVFKWFNKDAVIDYCATTVTKFREDYVKWLASNSTDNYDRVFVLDLDVHEHHDLLDTNKHFIIDHHKTHVEGAKYKNATTVVKIYSSAAKLVYKVFKTLYNADVSEQQKKLILITDDYDSYTHALPQSRMLNVLYWNTQKRFETYIKNFYNGFNGFSVNQSNTIKLFQQELQQLLDELNIYHLDLEIENKKHKILSTFATKFINDVADYLIEKCSADIAIVVNMNTKHVSFRKGKNATVNLIKFTDNVCNGGGGHEYASGGPLSTEFLEFTKSLKPYER